MGSTLIILGSIIGMYQILDQKNDSLTVENSWNFYDEGK